MSRRKPTTRVTSPTSRGHGDARNTPHHLSSGWTTSRPTAWRVARLLFCTRTPFRLPSHGRMPERRRRRATTYVTQTQPSNVTTDIYSRPLVNNANSHQTTGNPTADLLALYHRFPSALATYGRGIRGQNGCTDWVSEPAERDITQIYRRTVKLPCASQLTRLIRSPSSIRK